MRRLSTLSNSEKEEREDKRLVKQSPKKKPPRKDTKRTRVKDSDTSEKDPDKEQDKKDTSKNYKDAVYRVALRRLIAESPKMVSVKRKEDGKIVNVTEETLKGPDKSKYEEIKEEETLGEEGLPSTEETKSRVEKLKGDLNSNPNLTDEDKQDLEDMMEDITPEDIEELEALVQEKITLRDEEAKKKKKTDNESKRTPKMQKEFDIQLKDIQEDFRAIPKEDIYDALNELDWSSPDLIERDLPQVREKLQNQKYELYRQNPRLQMADDLLNSVDVIPNYLLKPALEKIKEETNIDTANLDKLSDDDFDKLEKELLAVKQEFNKGKLKPPSEVSDAFDEWDKEFEDSLPKTVVEKYKQKITKGTEAEIRKVRKELEEEEQIEKVKRENYNRDSKKKLQNTPANKREKRKEELEKKKKPSPEEVRELLSISEFEDMLDDPVARATDLPKEGEKPGDPALHEQALRSRANTTFDNYKNSTSDVISSNIRKIKDSLEDMDPTDAKTQEIRAMLQGLRFAEHYAKGMEGKENETQGLGSATAQVIDWALKDGGEALSDLMYAELAGADSPANAKAQEIIHKTLQKVTDEEWINLVPEGHPARALAEVLADSKLNGKGRFLSEQDREFLREQIMYVMGADTSYADPANVKDDPNGTVGENREKSKNLTSTLGAAPDIEDYAEGEKEQYLQDSEKWREDYEMTVTESFRDWDDSGVIDYTAEAERRKKEQEKELERKKKEQERELEERKKRLETPELVLEESRPSRTARNNFSINSLYHNIIGNRAYKGETKMRKVSTRQVRELTRAMDEMATTIQRMASQLGIPNRVAMDFAMRTDLISDAIEKNAGFDAGSIGGVVGGPLEMLDSDEPWMNGHFTQVDGEELFDMQESGAFSNAKAASIRRSRASLRNRRTRR